MPDYTAVFLPGTVITSQLTGTAVLAGDPLEVAAPPDPSGTVRRAAAATTAYIGIAAHDCDPGFLISVVAGKTVHQGPAEGAITHGDLVAPSAADGHQVTATADPVEAVGMAMTSAADTDPPSICRWIQR
jgi:Uncharacterized conserved protein (DUF2190)